MLMPCAGGNSRLGFTNPENKLLPTHVNTGGLQSEKCTWVQAGPSFCAVATEKGEIYTWGSGGFHLGNADYQTQAEPKQVAHMAGKGTAVQMM